MSYRLVYYFGDNGNVVTDLTLDSAYQLVSELFPADVPVTDGVGWSLWNGSELIESGPQTSA